MFYEELSPSEQFRGFIRCFWVLKHGSEAKNTRELILPDGCPEIVFNLAAPFRRHHDNLIELQPKAIVVGQFKQHVTVEPTDAVDLFGIRFEPAGIYPLLRQSANDLTNKIERVDAVLGNLGIEVEARINEAVSTKMRIAIFESAVFKSFEDSKSGNLAKLATRIILKNNGQIRIKELAKTLNTSWKTLERHFNSEVGITPKLFCRITRLQRIVKTLNCDQKPMWADIAYSYGYSDQAHFIREFREFAGVSPQTFINQQTAMSDSFVT